MAEPRPSDEHPHAPDAAPGWSDVWHLDAATAEGVGLTVRLECFPNENVAWFWTYLVLPTRPGPIVVRDHEVALPRQGLEIRAEGLWAELWCETPLEHWTYGLEAFAVALDDPADALAGEIGERMPLGLDLEWEVDGPVHANPDDWPVAGHTAAGIVHGEILLGRERLEFDARGEHRRQWGANEPRTVGAWSAACFGPRFMMHIDGSPDGSLDSRVSGFVDRMGEPRRAVTRGQREGGATAARFVLDGELEIAAEVLGGAPVPLTSTIVDRALCRFQHGDEVGHGWSELVEPL